jgi:hypothetical protein
METKNKFNHISNPLTIIGIFAGLAEVSGTVVLPFTSGEIQKSYIWFVMLFPVFLVIIFFLTLNFNPKVLYAPSDYKDEKYFVGLVSPSSTQEKLSKLVEESSDFGAPVITQSDPIQGDITLIPPYMQALIEENNSLNPAWRLQLIQGLVIDHLVKVMDIQAKREVKFDRYNLNYTFDAVFEKNHSLTVVEVKYISDKSKVEVVCGSLKKFIAALSKLPRTLRKDLQAKIIITGDNKNSEYAVINKFLSDTIIARDFPIELMYMDLSELIREESTFSIPL